MRSIKKIHQAEYRPIADLETYSPLPSRTINQVDPFIFLNHHGPQVYKPDNHGLPFGPHPHRGMETVTFIIDGDIMHKDSEGHTSVITAGGIQWMTAGSGIIHAETSSDNFIQHGGKLEILQLWVNLPSRLKMTKPMYKGFQKEDIPSINENGVTINLISGKYKNHNPAFEPLTDITIQTIHMVKDAELDISIPQDHNIFFYVIRGSVTVNGIKASMFQLVEFNNDNTLISVKCNQEAIILFGHAIPFNEPVVAQGPFVMNTEKEIREAYDDYQKGKFGVWKE